MSASCLKNLFDMGEISQSTYDDISTAYMKGATPDELLKKAETKIKDIELEKTRHAYDHIKRKELKSYLDNAPDKEEALYDLITLRTGGPAKKMNVEIVKEGVFGGLSKPIMKELDKVMKWSGYNKALLNDIGLSLFSKDFKLPPQAQGVAAAFKETFNDINNQLKSFGITPMVTDIKQLARLSPDIIKYSADEFIAKVQPMVTDTPDVIRKAYDDAISGEEVGMLNFKTGEDYQKYNELFDGNSFNGILGYLEKSAAQLAQVQVLGSNAKYTIEQLAKEAGLGSEVIAKAHKLLEFSTGAERIKSDPSAAAKGLSIMRPIGTASMLGAATVMTIADHATIALTAKLNGIPILQVYRSMVKMMSKSDRIGMAQLGFQLDSVMSVLTQTSRFNPHASISQTYNKISTGVLKYSGLMLATDIHTLAFKNAALVTFRNHMNNTFQGLAAKNIKLQKQLTKYDISESDWDIARKSMNNTDLLLDPMKLPDNVRAKFMRMINEEGKYAVIQPGAKSAWFTSLGGTQKGTVKGELARNITQFKSSIVEIVLRQVMRGLRQDTTANKVKYLAEYTVLTTIVGGMIMEIKQLLDGKTPIDPIKNPEEFVAGALRFGGGVPLLTDALLPYLIAPSDFEKMKQPTDLAMGMFTPPTLGQITGIGTDVVQSIIEKAKGDDDKAQKEISNAIQSSLKLVPGSNIWYFAEAYNTYVEDTVKKILDPGGYAKSKRRETKEMNKLDQDFLF